MSNNDHDQDPVWDLLDQSPPREAGPLFSRNVMREIRLTEETSTPWWKRLLAPRPLLASSLAAAAAVAIIVSVNPGEQPGSGGVAGSNPDQIPTPAAEQLDENLNQELLIAAAEDPTLFSDEQLLALLY